MSAGCAPRTLAGAVSGPRLQKGSRPHPSGERVQADPPVPVRSFRSLDLSADGRDPVLKLIAAELVTTPSARNKRAAFERILKTFPVAIQGARPTTAPSSAALSRNSSRSAAWPCRSSSHAVPNRMAGSGGASAPDARSSTKPPPSQPPSTSTGAMPDASWLTTTLSGPMPNRAEGCPSGIHANTLERASVAT